MPKKAKFDSHSVQDLEAYFRDAEGAVFRLGLRLGRYFRETDDVRARFIALQRLFKAYMRDVRPELAKISKKRLA
jgi:hypothetical protein